MTPKQRQERRAAKGNFKTVPERLKRCQKFDGFLQCVRRRHEGRDHKF